LATIHIDNLKGENAHHQAETIFKAFALALKQSCLLDQAKSGQIPSTKGCL
jgi:imidazoleglycerol-phosphate dehydratase